MNTVTREILAPAVARVGTAISGYLVGLGAANDLAEKAAIATTALVLVGIDLLLGHYFRAKK